MLSWSGFDSPPAGCGGGAPDIIGADVIGGAPPNFICPASPEGLFDEFIEGGCEDDCEFIDGGAIDIGGIDGDVIDGIVGIDGIDGGGAIELTGVKFGIEGGACNTGGVIVEGGGGCDDVIDGPDGMTGGDTDFDS